MRTNLIKTNKKKESQESVISDSNLDMNIERTDKETGERLVNINTIKLLVYNGVRYIVK